MSISSPSMTNTSSPGPPFKTSFPSPPVKISSPLPESCNNWLCPFQVRRPACPRRRSWPNSRRREGGLSYRCPVFLRVNYRCRLCLLLLPSFTSFSVWRDVKDAVIAPPVSLYYLVAQPGTVHEDRDELKNPHERTQVYDFFSNFSANLEKKDDKAK